MAYIGNKTASPSGTNFAVSDRVSVYQFTAGSSFTATRMALRGNSNADTIKFCIYEDDGADGPGDLLATGTERETVIQSGQWLYGNIPPTTITSSTKYWLGFNIETDGITYHHSGGATATELEYVNRDYSLGFLDPFGTPDADLSVYTPLLFADNDDEPIYLDEYGSLSNGAATVQDSTGIKIAVLKTDSNQVKVMSIPVAIGYPQYEDQDANTVVFGSAQPIGYLAAAIDSSDIIHVVVAATTNVGTRDVSYATVTKSAGRWTIGTWEAALADYSEQAPTTPGCAISIDSNDKPHVLFVDAVKIAGSTQDNVYYTEKTGASWASPTKIGARDTKTDNYRHPTIVLRNSDNREALYSGYISGTGYTVSYRTYVSSWSTEAHVDTSAVNPIYAGKLGAETNGTMYRYHYEPWTQTDHWENSVVIGAQNNIYNPGDTDLRQQPAVGSINDFSNRFVFRVDATDRDVKLYSNDGTGWTDKGALQVGTYVGVILGWSYNNLNNTTSIDYLYTDGTSVYWDEYVILVGIIEPHVWRLRQIRMSQLRR